MEVSPSTIRSSVMDSINSSMRSPTYMVSHGIFKRPDIVPYSSEFLPRNTFQSEKSEDNGRISAPRNSSPFRVFTTPKPNHKEKTYIRSLSPRFNLAEKAKQDSAEDQAEIVEYRKEFNNLESENRRLRNQTKLLSNEITMEREDKLALKNHYRTQERSFIDRIQQLEEELRKFKFETMSDISRTDNLELSLNEIKKQRIELAEENAMLKKQNKAMKWEMSETVRNLQRDVECLTTENENLKAKHDSFSISHDSIVNSKIQFLEKELEDQRNLNQKLRRENEENIHRLRYELSEQKSTIEDISIEKTEIIKSNEVYYKGIIKSLEFKLEDLETKYKQKVHENEEIQRQVNILKTTKISEPDEDRKHKLTDFENQITLNHRKINQLEQELSQATSKYAQLQSKIAKSRKSQDDIVPKHSASESNLRPSKSPVNPARRKRPVKPMRQASAGYNSETDGHRQCNACKKLKVGLNELLKYR